MADMKLQGVGKNGGFFSDLTKGIFCARPNRFVVECKVNQRKVRAYMPNPGRLWELLFPGSILYLVRHNVSYPGNTAFTVVAVERDGLPVMLHTHVNNLVARRLIEQGKVPGLEGSAVVRQEVTIGSSRFDFLLNKTGLEYIVEVKSCTLAGNAIAMFPDAMTSRGTKHLLELANIGRERKNVAVLFLVHWPRARFFMPDYHTDLVFSRALLAAKDTVMLKALSVEWNRDLSIGDVRDLEIPWDVLEREVHDQGSYIIVLRLQQDRQVSIGGLGQINFRRGYYLYVGSARAYLSKRIERHQRILKKLFWHIDYLRAVSDFRVALPIRTAGDIECEVAAALRDIAEWRISYFGSTDCSCNSHLFGMSDDPIHQRSFIRLLQYFRMDRLEAFMRKR